MNFSKNKSFPEQCTKSTKITYSTFKTVLLLSSIAAFAFMLSACSASQKAENTGNTSADKPITISATDVTSQVTGALSDIHTDKVLSYDDDTFNSNVETLYAGLDTNTLRDGCIAFDSTGSTADEISILVARDSEDVDTLKSILTKRASQRATDFGQYKPEETAKAQNAKVFACDNYVILAICENSGDARTEFMKVMQKAAA